MRHETGTAQGSGGELFWRAWLPDGEADFVALLVHGYGEHSGRYDNVAAALVRLGGAVYAPDHRGHGRSEGQRALIEDFDDVVGDLGAVAGLARDRHPGFPTVMVGHSMGGLIATLYAERYADQLAGLVLSGPVLGDWTAARELLALDDIPATPIDPDVLSRDPQVGRAYASDPLVYRGPFRRETLQALVDAIERADADADAVSLPVLHVHGEQDQLVPLAPVPAAVARFATEDVETHVYPGARHEVFNETNRDEVLGHVAAFVRRVLRS